MLIIIARLFAGSEISDYLWYTIWKYDWWNKYNRVYRGRIGYV